MIVRLAGATVDWLMECSSWGAHPHESIAAKDARDAIMGAQRRRVGKGYQIRVDLTEDEIESLAWILDATAGAGESMTGEERGEASGAYRAMRRDWERLGVAPLR